MRFAFLILIQSVTFFLLTSNTVLADQGGLESSKKIFVVIPKFTHAFFERTRRGCQRAASELDVICRYEPPRTFDVREQVRIIQDMLSIGVDGIAIAPISSSAIARALKLANNKNIPVITFDSDLREEDRHLRRTYIGSHNASIGIELGNLLNKLRPQGGLLMIQAGEPPAENIKERLNGFMSTVDKAKWKQIPGSPMYCDASEQIAIRQLEDSLHAYPNLSAFVALGAWPQVAKRGYQQVLVSQKDRIDKNDLVLLAADTLEMQMELLEEGYTQGLVGQRPFEMGTQAIEILHRISRGEDSSIKDPIYTGLDICTRDNVGNCVSGDRK